jgi:hypothetical protein
MIREMSRAAGQRAQFSVPTGLSRMCSLFDETGTGIAAWLDSATHVNHQ